MLIGALILLDVSAFAHPNGAEAGASGAASWSFEPLVTVALLVTFLWGMPARYRETLGRWSKYAPIAATWRTMTGALFVWLLQPA